MFTLLEQLENRTLFAAGSLDLGFGENGLAIGDRTREATTVAVQDDGKIVVAGIAWAQPRNSWQEPSEAEMSQSRLWIARFNADGTSDTSFSSDGEKIIGIRPYDPRLVLQTDGKIVVLGNGTKLYRLNADASLDTTFDGNGRQTLGMVASDVVIQSTGKIVVGGGYTSGTYDYVLQRFDGNGLLDTTFGDGGTSRLRLPSDLPGGEFIQNPDADIRRLAVGANDEIAAGSSISHNVVKFLAAKYDADGHLDTSFGTNGLIAIGPEDRGVRDIAIAPNGDVIIAGEETFLGSGPILHIVGKGDAQKSSPGRGGNKAMLVMDDGRILTVGRIEVGNWEAGDFLLSRHNADGTLDATFGTNGVSIHNVEITDPESQMPSSDRLNHVAITPDGNIITVGISDNRFVIARYQGTGDATPVQVAKLKSNGSLVVHGTPDADEIIVKRFNDYASVRLNGVTQNFDLADVASVRIYGFDGNDRITMSLNIQSSLFGGDGNDQLYAGDGQSLIRGHAGNDDLGSGDGNDRLYGDAGDDRLIAGDGDDYLHGGDGNDKLYSGDGNDILYGRAGDDWFDIRNSARVFGGGGRDSVRGADANDELVSIEELIA